MIDYFSIIHKHIDPDSQTYPIYITHVHMVTKKALDIARKMDCSSDQITFIEEASMLHDIGIVGVDDPDIYCFGQEEYLAHPRIGFDILQSESLPKHARVALCHTGVGITKQEIIDQNLPLPHADLFPETPEEKIISFADLFYGKGGNLWEERSTKRVRTTLAKHGEEKVALFEEWYHELESYV
ncbi:phosphohydrolase [candidate division WWE3 bacterium]|uniref:Phosphohydrolase n=1 Tax=candidate division WWE3 bacterium TaxID=2053526 RepID=A0A955RX98_UNCKA|nr:phosphohydrolase [candidate division WWE3 bacterium]